MIGTYFLDQCFNTRVEHHPWSYQILKDSLPINSFEKLKNSCEKFLNPVEKLTHIYPKNFKDHGINWYEEIYELGHAILDNAKKLCDLYPKYRWFPKLSLNGHISITPPLPYKFHIHEEGLEKIWSSVTYITPKKNVGTKMYNSKDENSFVKEAEWHPNSTFIFCGEQGKTWHSYESNQNTNRITLNFFLMKDSDKNFLRN
jgi:hypothetical protein